ncbi:EcoRII N-terminal effector-binding domain-containing protein [Burkholderia ubonensis]|uniref:EcoRII N-terminal effector-binding domain-containing protein n=1 Tax=Burkholderia ubonensis TaxID=101571 RepID=UPI0009B3A823|nr:EcoRII N-terminal effector-binding domain-containing protein [Burkholderia ubonensis]
MAHREIAKILSANDTGETGAHQAGILVPKESTLLSFFPALDASHYNPRVHLRFLDDGGSPWEFAFIYYNNALFKGTRNEYRLTRMTKYIRQAGLVAGDELILSCDSERYRVSHRRKDKTAHTGKVLQLGTGWRVIQL